MAHFSTVTDILRLVYHREVLWAVGCGRQNSFVSGSKGNAGLLFSFEPRCQGRGSQKKSIGNGVRRAKSSWQAITDL